MLLVGRSKPDCFVELDNVVVVDGLDGGKEVGDMRLVCNVFRKPLREDEGGGLDGLVKCDDPIAVRKNNANTIETTQEEAHQKTRVLTVRPPLSVPSETTGEAQERRGPPL